MYLDNKINLKKIDWWLVVFGAVIICGLAYFVISYKHPGKLQRVTVSQPTQEYNADISGCGETFDKPIDIVWDGEIFFTMSSGDCLGLIRIPEDKQDPKFFACGVDCTGGGNCFDGGKVRITGKWVGTTCMYANAAFDGRLVPEVDIEKIEKIK